MIKAVLPVVWHEAKGQQEDMTALVWCFQAGMRHRLVSFCFSFPSKAQM